MIGFHIPNQRRYYAILIQLSYSYISHQFYHQSFLSINWLNHVGRPHGAMSNCVLHNSPCFLVVKSRCLLIFDHEIPSCLMVDPPSFPFFFMVPNLLSPLLVNSPIMWNHHGFSMVFLCFSYGFPMVFLWFSHQITTVPMVQIRGTSSASRSCCRRRPQRGATSPCSAAAETEGTDSAFSSEPWFEWDSWW